MRIVIMGAGGFALELLDLAERLGHEVVAVFDERGTTSRDVLGSIGVVDSIDDVDADAAAIAVGDPSVRARFLEMARGRFPLPVLTHPSACVSPRASIAEGCLIMQNAVINSGSKVGAGTLVNVGCCIGHECEVGECCHLAPAVQLAGCSSVGDVTMLGTGTTVLPGVRVGNGSLCGAGSVITREVEDGILVTGIPARKVRALAPEPVR